MYPIIGAYFKDTLRCDAVFMDGGGGEVYLRLPKDLHTREVDVVALQNPDGIDARVHLVEAKMLTKGNAFEDCFSQLDSIRERGDRLWVAFPESEWRSLEEGDRKRNERRLDDAGFGLLLVNRTDCFPEVAALPNRTTESQRSDVLQQLGFAKDIFTPNVCTLGVAEARTAGGIMALTSLIADIVYELERRKANFQKYWDSEQDKNFVEHGWFVPSIDFSGKVGCELDPFGRLLEDGFPTAWVEIELSSLESVSATLDRGSSFGTHVYLDDGGWKWKTISIADGTSTIKYWADRGLDQTFKLMQRIEILGRVRESLKSDFKRAIKEARKCLTDPLK
jgi:hypothetical protein